MVFIEIFCCILRCMAKLVHIRYPRSVILLLHSTRWIYILILSYFYRNVKDFANLNRKGQGKKYLIIPEISMFKGKGAETRIVSAPQ